MTEPTTPKPTRKAANPSKGLAPTSGKGMGYGYMPTPPSNSSPYTELGQSGLAQYGGFIREEFLAALQGDRALSVWREMYDNDPIVGALVFAVQMLIRQVQWRIEPPQGGSVEEIVQRREDARVAEAQAKQQEQMNQLAQAQATAADPNASGGGDGVDDSHAFGNPAANPPKRSGFASPLPQPPTPPFHAPIAPKKGPGGSGVKKAAGISGVAPGNISFGDPAAGTDPETGEPVNLEGDLNDDGLMSPEERKGEELAVFIETCLHDLDCSWADFLAEVMTMIVFGFSFFEIVYKKRKGWDDKESDPTKTSKFDDGKIGWAKLASRAQETRWRWEFSDNGDVLGMWQIAPPNFTMNYIPMTKALLFRTTSQKGNPEGRSSLRSAYVSWYFKRRIQELEAIGVERDLAGLPIAYVPYQMMTSSATNEERITLEEIKKLVRNIRRDEQEGIVFPMVIDPDSGKELYRLELLSTGSRRQFDTDKIIARYDQRIAMTILADFILLGHEAVGSKALGETKADMFTSALESWLNSIADIFNAHAIPRLLKMNGEDPANCPRLVFGKLSHIRPAELAQFVSQVAQAGGITPDAEIEDALRRVVGLPKKGSSEDL